MGGGIFSPLAYNHRRIMKKILNITFILTLLFIFLSTFTYADRNKPTIVGISTSQCLKTGDWKIYRISYVVTSNGGNFTVYDSTTSAGSSNSNVKAEGSEAVAINGKTLDFTGKPLEGSTGLYIVVNSANLVVEYE